MRSFQDWAAEQPPRSRSPWLILGKGPSFAELERLDTSGLLRFGLNHVVRETRVDVFHCIDIEVVEHCGDAIIDRAGVALLPWVPHIRRRLVPFSNYREFLPGGRTLQEYLDEYPVLRRLANQDRLLWYNLHTAPRRLRRAGAPVVTARGFSASAAVALLGSSGVRRIRTLGIDGGRRYAGDFRDLNDKTLLAAGQTSFDSQFRAIAALIHHHGLDFGPLQQPLPACVFIDADPDQAIPARVLANTLRRNTSLSLAIETRMRDAAPDAGPAITLSADSLVEQDLRDAWTARVAPDRGDATPTFATIDWPASGPQPWRHSNALQAARWCRALFDALDHGALKRADLESEAQAGKLRRSLLWQVDHRLADPMLLPAEAWRADRYTGPAAVRRRSLRSRASAQLRRTTEALDWPRWARLIRLATDKLRKIAAGMRGGPA